MDSSIKRAKEAVDRGEHEKAIDLLLGFSLLVPCDSIEDFDSKMELLTKTMPIMPVNYKSLVLQELGKTRRYRFPGPFFASSAKNNNADPDVGRPAKLQPNPTPRTSSESKAPRKDIPEVADQ